MVTKKKYRIHFTFDCSVVYLQTCQVCLKPYVWSIVARFSLRFNKQTSNIKLNEEVQRAFKQEKLIENFFLSSHNGTHQDIKVQINGHCDPNGQETREDFWVFYLDILYPKGLNQKQALK